MPTSCMASSTLQSKLECLPIGLLFQAHSTWISLEEWARRLVVRMSNHFWIRPSPGENGPCVRTLVSVKSRNWNMSNGSSMPAHKEIEKLGGLFEHVAAEARPFLDKCSETKFLAVRDYGRAIDEYRSLAQLVLDQSGGQTAGWSGCGECLTAVRSALDNERIGAEVLGALTELRSVYVNRVLKPAVKEFLSGQAERPHDVGSLYDNVLRLDGLLDAARFLKNLSQT